MGVSSLPKAGLVTVTLAHMLNHVYVQIHLALIPVFMAEFGLTLFAVGLMVMIPLICESLVTIPSGMLADKIESTRLIAFSLLLTSGAAILTSQAPNVFIIVLSFSLLAVATTLYHPPGYSITSELFPTRYRSTAFGIHGAGGTFGMALGPLSIGLLISIFGWRFVYFIWAFPALLCILLLRYLHPVPIKRRETRGKLEDAHTESGWKALLTAGFITFLLMIGINSVSRSVVSTFLSPYLVLIKGVPVPTASIVLSLMPLVGIVAAPSGGFLADKLGEKRWLSIAFTGTVLALVAIAYTEAFWSEVVLIVLYGYFIFSAMGANASLVAHFTSKSRRGIGYATFFLPTYLAGAVAPLMGAYVAENFGIWNVFPMAVGMTLLALVTLQFVPYKRRA